MIGTHEEMNIPALKIVLWMTFHLLNSGTLGTGGSGRSEGGFI